MEEEFVYESCCPTKLLGTTMSGWFEFIYKKGPNKNKTFNAMIDPFTLNIQEGTKIVENSLFQEFMLY